MAKQKQTIASVKKLGDEGATWRFNVAGAQDITVKLTDLPMDVVGKLAVFGLVTKLGNAYVTTAIDGQVAENASDEDRVRAAQALFQNMVERLKAGDWRAERGASGPSQATRDLASAVIWVRQQDGLAGDIDKAVALFHDWATRAAETRDDPEGKTDPETGDVARVPTDEALTYASKLSEMRNDKRVSARMKEIRAERATEGAKGVTKTKVTELDI